MARKNKVWVDTSFVYAVLSQEDKNHIHAHEAVPTIRASNIELFTSDHVLAESYTLARVRIGWQAAQDSLLFFERLHVRILYGSRTLMNLAGDWTSWNDQDFSFVDCLSFAWMKSEKIPYYLSFDGHFQTAGFTDFLNL